MAELSSWRLPLEEPHEISSSASNLSFVGGAGDFDEFGNIQNPYKLRTQLEGTLENIKSALAKENCGIVDIVRLKIFYSPTKEIDEFELIQILLELLPKDPAPVISSLPARLQPFSGQEVQIQVIAQRNWRSEQNYRFETKVLNTFSNSSHKQITVTSALRTGEFIALANRTAGLFDGLTSDETDGVKQTHLIMQSLDESLRSVGASLQDSIKLESYYFGTSRKEWSPLAKARADYFKEPGPPATAIPYNDILPYGSKTKVGALAMRELRNTYDKYIPREDSWPPRVWDWQLNLPWRQAQKLRGMVWLGGQVPAEPFSNTGKRMFPGELLPQTQFTMSYVEDLLRPFNCKTSDIKLLVCYFQKSNDENIIGKMLELLRNCCGGVLPPLTLIPVPHMQTPDSTVEIWGVVQS